MSKRKRQLILLLCLTVLLASCGVPEGIVLLGKDTTAVNRSGTASLNVIEISADGITYEIENRGPYGIGIGSAGDFFLEIKNGFNWYSFELNGKNFNTIPSTLDMFVRGAGETVRYSQEWYSFMGSLPAGHYRIKLFVKVQPYEGAPTREWQRYGLAAEFTIEE